MESIDELDALETYLKGAAVLRAWEGITGPGGGHPNKYRVELDGGVYVVAKVGEDDGALRMASAEAAAWSLTRLLGWEDLMSATVLRSIDLGGKVVPASVQVIWPSFEWVTPLDQLPADAVLRAAVFDVLVRMNDRGGSNWLGVGPPGEPKNLKLIDHGHAFTGQGAVGSAIFDFKQTTALADDVCMALRDLTKEVVDAGLHGLVADAVVADIAGRAAVLGESGLLSLPPNGV